MNNQEELKRKILEMLEDKANHESQEIGHAKECITDLRSELARLQKAFALACRHLHDEMGLASSGPELQRAILDRVDTEQVCRVCGCTQDNACPGGCSWVEEDLCSACEGKEHERY